MRRRIIVVLGVVLIAGAGWAVYQEYVKRSAPVGVGAGTTGPAASAAKSPAKAETKIVPSLFYKEPEQVPPGYEDFHELSQMKRLNRVTEEMSSPSPMDPELYTFYKAELFNRNHWNVTRNNMANALVWARDAEGNHPDPDLHKAFITMLEDETEDPVWRDYCLQFLSENIEHAGDPKLVTETIAKFSKGDDSIAGTAMIHMAIQEDEGRMELDEAFNQRLATQLEKKEVHRDTKLAILGVMGKRKDIKRLPLIRKYAMQDENAGLKRVAIAALGTIGASPETVASLTDEDKAVLKAALSHRNGAVKLAAKGALARMAK